VIRTRSSRAGLAFGLTCGLLLSLTPAAGAATFSNNAQIAIPIRGPASPYPSTIPVPPGALTGKTTDVNVTLNGLTHTAPIDLAVVLVPPEGTNILLMQRASSNDDAGNVNVTFDDAAPGRVPVPLASGSYKPSAFALDWSFATPGPGTNYCNPGPAGGGTSCTLASALNGADPIGDWKLYVVDMFDNDQGQIAGGWSLDITAGGSQRSLEVTNVSTGGGTLVGSGKVTGSGVDCGVDCFGAYDPSTQVTLTATPAAGSNFGGWNNCPAPVGNTCAITMDSDKDVTATFNPNPPATLTVRKDGTSIGTVTGTGINCGADCTETYNGGSIVDLTAFPGAGGTRFGGWAGCDSASENRCTVTVAGDKTVTAKFDLVTGPPTTPPLQPPIAAPPSGAVSTPATPAPPTTDSPGPPRLELGGSATQKLGSVIEVTAETDEPATLVADGTIAAPRTVAKLSAAQRKAKTFRLPAVRADAPARTRVVLKLAVPRKALAAIRASLKRGRRATARVTVVATDPAGDRRPAVRTIRIKR